MPRRRNSEDTPTRVGKYLPESSNERKLRGFEGMVRDEAGQIVKAI